MAAEPSEIEDLDDDDFALTVWLSREQNEELKASAARNHRSMEETVRLALEQFIWNDSLTALQNAVGEALAAKTSPAKEEK